MENWLYNNRPLFADSSFVDSMQTLVGGTITIFQKTDSGFVRMATNVRHKDGRRATATFIPNNSPVLEPVKAGKTYYGRASILNEWYVTAYKPIVKDNVVIGMLYVGDKEKDMEELKKIISRIKIGNSGYAFVFDSNGYMYIHPNLQGEYLSDTLFLKQMRGKQNGLFNYVFENREKTIAFTYFEPFDVYIAASIVNEEENRAFLFNAVSGAVVVALFAALLLMVLVYYFTSNKLINYLNKLQQSNKRIVTISEALKESEERFQKLFDSTGDDIFVTDVNENIVEINNAACKTLGYSRDELLKMKITEIKTPRFKNYVSENRRIIYEKGSYSFESEHVAKDGIVIPVEFISRVVSYKNEKLILSVVRNLTHRREMEREILSTIIHTEERERERFAKDMHDGLGPLLSTIKLYVNELKSVTMSDEEREEMVNYCNQLIDDAVNATRTISNNLMPRIINTHGLIKAVEQFCHLVNKTNKLNITFDSENIERLEQNMEIILFRVISELINNTIKHAGAERVFILLLKRENVLSLYFKDDGRGFDVDEVMKSDKKGMGLKNIISRIKSINGNYEFKSRLGEGFSIKIEIVI
ncbi:MAG: Sensor histidine kinase ComP [Bacteroidetes bacterium ADurb.Bin408]|nr:MAG: Sensor histidine kinase ComP [Bacteroidetes bacterium ADurb.Bin408]